MTTHRDPAFDPRIADWLEADPTDAPGAVLETVLAALPSIPQRRPSRLPWRFFVMSTNARLAATAAVLVVAVGGLAFLGRLPGVGGPSPSPLPTATAAPSGRIAYTCGQDICVMTAAGALVARISNDADHGGYFPSLSPDGTEVAFSAQDTGGTWQIWVMNFNGSNLRQVTRNTFDASWPTWSPDGTRIAYGNAEASDLRIVNADGTGDTHVITVGSGLVDPTWSADGLRIAFISDNVYSVKVDGTGLTQLTVKSDGGAAWSPGGSQIAFSRDDGVTSQIFVMNADGTGQVKLTSISGHATYPTWSPDGLRIGFSEDNGTDTNGIYVMNADGSGVTRLTTDSANNWHASWH